MGIMDIVEKVTGGLGGTEKTQVATGVMDELQSRPGGVGSIFSAFQNNGLGGLVKQWAGGQTAPASSEQVEQGLGGTGIIDSIANRLGLSPTVVKAGLAVVLPMLIHHYTPNGHMSEDGQPTGTPVPEHGSVLQSVLSHIL